MEIIPGISKRQIDDARRHADLRGPESQAMLQKLLECALMQRKLITF